MFRKHFSARTKALLSACLLHNSDDEDSDSNDIIEATPESSPTKVNKTLPVADAEPLLTASTTNNDEKSCERSKEPPAISPLSPRLPNVPGERSIEPPSYSSLTPRPPNVSGERSIELSAYSPLTPRPPNVSGERSIELSAYSPLTPRPPNVPGERSIEPPAYSPLTPRPQNVLGERSIELPAYSPLTPRPLNVPGERSIEPPAYSPLTPRPPNVQILMSPKPHCSTKENMLNSQFSSSPLRPMSPETAKLFNILNDTLDNEEFNINSNENAALGSPISSDITNIMNSDDSVQDPDFVCYDENGKFSDKSSENSVSLLATTEEGPQTAIEVLDETNTSNHYTTSLILQEEDIETVASSQGRPKRGRKRLYGGDLREERKKRKYNNLSYVNSKKQVVESKVFIDYSCNCPRQCQENVSTEQKKEEFNKFYSFGSYVAQNMYLIACIKEKPKKRSYVTTAQHHLKRNKKTYTREYYLKNILVCKQMFLNTLQTSSKRINTALCKMRNNCLKDMRGLQAGHNVASTDSELFLQNIINKLPTYISHYRRAKSNDAKFLTSDMTLPKIYNLYSEEAKSAGQEVLSYSKVRHVFVTKFNLRTKPLKKDTCNKCDFYESRKNHASEEEKRKIEEDHQRHIDKAKFLQLQLKKDMKLAKDDPTIECMTFDLQKTLPLPRIPTNIMFYKRQLWVYNLGIHTGSDDQAHCNVWVEGEAGRGSQEVGSCLIKHITEILKDGVESLFLWSDSCGGQNRNIKLTLMLKALLNDHPTLKEIHHRFLESGHSFLPNDTDFGRIECSLKHQQRLYTPDDYIEIMKSCRKIKPMIVHRLTKEDFMSSCNLEKKITNRKKAVDGSKISWLNTKEIVLKKEKMYSIFMRNNLDDELKEVNIKKNIRSRTVIRKSDMDLLWPTGKAISEAKLSDIKSILHLIPNDAKDFYKTLTSINIEDDIDGFTGPIDFEVEGDDNNSDD